MKIVEVALFTVGRDLRPEAEVDQQLDATVTLFFAWSHIFFVTLLRGTKSNKKKIRLLGGMKIFILEK